MPLLDEAKIHQAQMRAIAAAIAGRASAARQFRVGGEVELRGSARSRKGGWGIATPSEGRAGKRRTWRRALLILAAEIVAVPVLLLSPAFRAADVLVSGNQLLNSAEVARAASVQGHNLFTLDTGAVTRRLEAVPWIESAQVHLRLPNQVTLQVHEWTPAFWFMTPGKIQLLAPSSATVGLSAARAQLWRSLPVITGDAASGRPDPGLLAYLMAADRSFPAALGVDVVGYEYDSDGNLSLWTSAGWRAVLGHVDGVHLQLLPDKLAALSTLRHQINYRSPDFGYIDVENPAAPDVGGKPGFDTAIANALRQQLSFGIRPQLHLPAARTIPAPANATPAPQPPAAAAPAQPAASPAPVQSFSLPPPPH